MTSNWNKAREVDFIGSIRLGIGQPKMSPLNHCHHIKNHHHHSKKSASPYLNHCHHISLPVTRTNGSRKVREIQSGSWQRWQGWRMIICKRPVPPDGHLQEAGPSGWVFARGWSLRMIICKRPAPQDDHLQEAGPSGWSFGRGRSLRMINNNNNYRGNGGSPGWQGWRDRRP